MKVGKDSKLNYSSSASNLIKLRKNSQQINSK